MTLSAALKRVMPKKDQALEEGIRDEIRKIYKDSFALAYNKVLLGENETTENVTKLLNKVFDRLVFRLAERLTEGRDPKVWEAAINGLLAALRETKM
jgi:hypothetical protein